MRELIEGFSQQLQKAVEIGRSIQVQAPAQEIRNIVVAGLGGSGIGANLVESFVRTQIKVPYLITKTYDIPNFVGPHTLFIASSFSGGTEETLSALEKARERNAKIFCVTSGGKMKDLAEENNIDYIQIPNEAPCPRAFVGYSMTQLLFALKAYGLIDGFFEDHLQEAIDLIQAEKEAIHEQAKALAGEIKDRSLIVYSDMPLAAMVTRFQQQINENAKQLFHSNVFPEMNHNELVGWGLDAQVYKDILVLMVQSSFDHPRVTKRMEICQPIFAEKAYKVLELQPKGASFIAQNIFYIHLFDWVSFYLSELNEVDVFEIKVINHLKSELAKF